MLTFLKDDFVESSKDDKWLLADSLKSITTLKIFSVIAGSRSWTVKEGGKSILIEHPGMRETLYDILTKSFEDLPSYACDEQQEKAETNFRA